MEYLAHPRRPWRCAPAPGRLVPLRSPEHGGPRQRLAEPASADCATEPPLRPGSPDRWLASAGRRSPRSARRACDPAQPFACPVSRILIGPSHSPSGSSDRPRWVRRTSPARASSRASSRAPGSSGRQSSASALAASEGQVLLPVPRLKAKARIAARSRSRSGPALNAVRECSAPGPALSRIRSSSRRGPGRSVIPPGSHRSDHLAARVATSRRD